MRDRQSLGNSLRGQPRVFSPLSPTLMLTVLLVALCGSSAVAQTSAGSSASDQGTGIIPLGNLLQSDGLLEFAASKSALALQDEAGKHYFDAAQKYESILVEADKTPSSSTAFHMMKAAAYMDAARTRFYYGTTLAKSPALYESNHTLISDHIAGAQSELKGAVGGQNLRSVNLVGWSCDASKLTAQSYYLQGMLNNTPGDLDKSISDYEFVARCEPSSKPQVDNLTAYIEHVKANMAHSPLSSDEIMKDISGTLHLFGWKGDAISMVVQRVYESHEGQQKPPPIAVH